ncbi:hypothetical protein D9M72_255360 [compost metagenome]
MAHHEPAAQGPRGVQRAADVGLGAVAVPVADAQRCVGAEGALRPLGHEVDGGRRIARAVQQTGRAAQYLHALVHRHVLRRAGGVAQQDRHAVLFERVDLETACVVAGRELLIRLHGDARGLLQHVVERAQVLLFHARLVDDGDRLRRLLERLRQLGDGRFALGRRCDGDAGQRALRMCRATPQEQRRHSRRNRQPYRLEILMRPVSTAHPDAAPRRAPHLLPHEPTPY